MGQWWKPHHFRHISMADACRIGSIRGSLQKNTGLCADILLAGMVLLLSHAIPLPVMSRK